MLKQTTLRALAPLSLALALATGGLALSAPALANQAAQQVATATVKQVAPAPLKAVEAARFRASIAAIQSQLTLAKQFSLASSEQGNTVEQPARPAASVDEGQAVKQRTRSRNHT